MQHTINGLAKLTLLDFPGKTAATVFLAGCNLRCPFCHNAPLVTELEGAQHIGYDELEAFLKKRAGLLDGIAITGGEPTLRPELDELLSLIKRYGYATKLDTNGTDPVRLGRLIDDGLLDYVAMDIKNSPAKYALTAGLADIDMDAINESISLLRGGSVEHEFRTTVVCGLHTPDDMEQIGRWLSGETRYFLQNFVDSGALIVPGTKGVSPDEMRKYLEIVRRYIPTAELRGM